MCRCSAGALRIQEARISFWFCPPGSKKDSAYCWRTVSTGWAASPSGSQGVLIFYWTSWFNLSFLFYLALRAVALKSRLLIIIKNDAVRHLKVNSHSLNTMQNFKRRQIISFKALEYKCGKTFAWRQRPSVCVDVFMYFPGRHLNSHLKTAKIWHYL